MNSIDEYIDKAKELNGIQSDRELSRALGKNPAVVNQWRTKRTWPADDTMVKLATLAHVDPNLALLDLGEWRTEGPAKRCYSSIKKLLQQGTLHAAGLLGLVHTFGMGTGAEQGQHTISSILYIMYYFNT